MGRVFDGTHIDIDLVPPLPLRRSAYICDKEFRVDLIEDLFERHEVYGLVLIGGEETLIYRVEGTRQDRLDRLNVHRQSRHKAGGQSAPRFQRIREGQIQEYINLIVERLNHRLTLEAQPLVEAWTVVSTSRDIASRVIEAPELYPCLRERLADHVTVETLDLVTALPHLKQKRSTRDTATYTRIFDLLAANPRLVVYGRQYIVAGLTQGLIREIVIHQDLDFDFELCQRLGVTVTRVTEHHGQFTRFGNIMAIRWYPGDDVDLEV